MIDDDAELAQMSSRMLVHAGYQAVAVTDAREALTVCDDHRPGLVFVDLAMPYMDGEMFALRLRVRLGDDAPRIVLVTASPEREEVASRLDLFDSIEKPFAMNVLLETARRAFELAR